MLLSEIEDKLYVNKEIVLKTPQPKEVLAAIICVFEKGGKFYLVEGYPQLTLYRNGILADVLVEEKFLFKFKRSEYTLLAKTPHHISDICQRKQSNAEQI